MKYIVQVEIDPDTGVDAEGQPDKNQEVVGKWQALNPIGMYFYTTRRAMTVIVDVPNEDRPLRGAPRHLGSNQELPGRFARSGWGGVPGNDEARRSGTLDRIRFCPVE